MERSKESSSSNFDEIVAPLEAIVGHRLNGPGRAVCLRAFGEEPNGFLRLVDQAQARGRNPLSLLVKMASDGDHRLPTPSTVSSTPPTSRVDQTRRGKGSCAICDAEGDDFLWFGGQVYCGAHEDRAA
jgi:hypothetical protein